MGHKYTGILDSYKKERGSSLCTHIERSPRYVVLEKKERCAVMPPFVCLSTFRLSLEGLIVNQQQWLLCLGRESEVQRREEGFRDFGTMCT